MTTNNEPGRLDEPDDKARRELTPEERERLSHLAASLRNVVVPKVSFKLPNIVDTSAFAKLVADAAKFSSFTLPESTFENLAAITGIADHQAKFLDAIRPTLGMQSAWANQTSFISSDIFKTHAATQARFAELSTMLTKNIDFGAFAKIGLQFAEQQLAWLETTGLALDRLRESFYPPNLRDIKDLKFKDVEKVVMVDGIALYGLPRLAVSKALIQAESAAKRREILGRRWRTISTDCREVLNGCKSQPVAAYVPFAVAALDALDGGHTAAAQALAGALIDTILTAYFGNKRYLYTPDKKGGRTTAAYYEFGVRQFVAFSPMWQAYQQFWASEGDTVPTTFNRNATAHAVSERQFSRRNAVQALLFAVSLIYFLNEQARRKANR